MEEFLSFFTALSSNPAFKAAKGTLVAISILLLVGFIFAFKKAWEIKPKYRIRGQSHGRNLVALRSAVFRERWESVLRRFSANSPEAMRLAVIEADTLVDSVLKDMGLEGEHMADRLSGLSPDAMKSLQGLWRAHRLRNDLVHTPGFFLAPEDVRQAIKAYEAFLREVKVLS